MTASLERQENLGTMLLVWQVLQVTMLLAKQVFLVMMFLQGFFFAKAHLEDRSSW